jgi:spoIIIJ-associated protein
LSEALGNNQVPEYVEFRARTVDAAVHIASHELGVDAQVLKYDIVSHGSSGIFGLVGVKPAVIRVNVAGVPEKQHQLSEADTQSEAAPSDGSPQDGPDKGSPPEADAISKPMVAAVSTDHDVSADSALQQLAHTLLLTIVGSISEEARIDARHRGREFSFDITGGNSALLIGKRGQTLEAMQFIVEKAVNKQAQERIRVQVDVEGYLAQRRASLIDTAERMANRAKRSGKPTTLGQMNAYDRRIVHLALKKVQGVRTQSLGEGQLRKLVIFPRKARQRRKGGVSSQTY